MLSLCCQLVNIVEVRQVQDVLDNEAQFICCLNRLSEKLLSLHRKQSLSKGEKEGFLEMTNQERSLHMWVLKILIPCS